MYYVSRTESTFIPSNSNFFYDIVTPRKPVVYCCRSKPIYPFSDETIKTEKKANVRFNTKQNKTIYINGKDFYKKNDMKQKIWWSPQELNHIKNLFMVEVRDFSTRAPNKTPRQCILELCNNADHFIP